MHHKSRAKNTKSDPSATALFLTTLLLTAGSLGAAAKTPKTSSSPALPAPGSILVNCGDGTQISWLATALVNNVKLAHQGSCPNPITLSYPEKIKQFNEPIKGSVMHCHETLDFIYQPDVTQKAPC
ncbi:MAG: hypothetical protein EXR81_05965, partial [Gammaproteobacteria bacterium]|nr:hypothetical protein [Gammaproteobacteria bacterium]